MTRGPPPPGAGAGADPIVKRLPPGAPPEVEGANGVGPLNGDDGETDEPKPPPPKPVDMAGCGNVK